MRQVRGKRIAMILQDPMASLNPLFSIGNQVGEPIRVHEGASRASAWQRAIGLLKSVRIASPRDPRVAVPPRDVGRHAPAHRRRHRHLLRAAPADRRRADHQPRSHHPGAIPQPVARAAARARAGADLHHPQSRHRRQDVRPARRDVCRTGRRAGTGVAHLQRAGASLHQGAARLDPAHDRQPPTISPPSRASRPISSSLPPGCSFAPRCPVAFARCRAEAPPEFAVDEGRTARCWLAVPDADAKAEMKRSNVA